MKLKLDIFSSFSIMHLPLVPNKFINLQGNIYGLKLNIAYIINLLKTKNMFRLYPKNTFLPNVLHLVHPYALLSCFKRLIKLLLAMQVSITETYG